MLRLWALVVLFGSLTISGYYRARARKLSGTIERRREGGLALAARAAGGLGAFGSILAHALVPGVMGWASFRAPDWVAWTGATVGLFVIPGTYWVFSSIGRNVSETVLTKTNHDLVQHGPYRWIRHPLYTVGVPAAIRSWADAEELAGPALRARGVCGVQVRRRTDRRTAARVEIRRVVPVGTRAAPARCCPRDSLRARLQHVALGREAPAPAPRVVASVCSSSCRYRSIVSSSASGGTSIASPMAIATSEPGLGT